MHWWAGRCHGRICRGGGTQGRKCVRQRGQERREGDGGNVSETVLLDRLLSLPSIPSPVPSLLSRVWVSGLESVGLTPKQPKLTYFRDRGHWSSDRRGALSILPRTRRWSQPGCWAGMCHGHTPSCGMVHSRAGCQSAWAPSGSPEVRCWCKGSGCNHGSWCHSAQGPGAELRPHCSSRACLGRDTESEVRFPGVPQPGATRTFLALPVGWEQSVRLFFQRTRQNKHPVLRFSTRLHIRITPDLWRNTDAWDLSPDWTDQIAWVE